jgi:Asp/Glu/hydantoin racemase
MAMTKKVALIHTSFIFFERERLLFELFDELLPDVQKMNIVEDTMLAEVMQQNAITPDVVRRMCQYVLAAEALKVDVIFSTCSSLGPAFDVARQLVSIPTLKIDDAMAEQAVSQGNRIAVLATVPTTLGPTIDLILQKAQSFGKTIEIRRALADGAFKILTDGKTELHDNMVSQKAKEVSNWADTLVLAQCSMARLAPRLTQETSIPVLSSPRLAVQRLKEILTNLT